MPSYDVMTMIYMRNAYYRKLYLYALTACVLGLMVIAGLTFTVIAIMRIPNEPLYFPANAAGELIDEKPLNQLNMPIEQVKEWVVNAVEASSTFNFVNYRSQLQTVSNYFTDYGWYTFKRALLAEGTIQAVVERKWIMTAHVSGDPALVQQGMIKGHLAWKFTMPLLVTTWGAPYDEHAKGLTPLKVTVIVQRQPLLQSFQGLGIVQYYSYNAAAAPTGEEEMTFDQT